jgi:hypothetical protein
MAASEAHRLDSSATFPRTATMTQDFQSEGKAVVLRRFEKFDKLHSQESEPALASIHKPQAGGPCLYDHLALKHVPRGWLVYPDGAMRSDEGSLSELSSPPEDKVALWGRIAEFWTIRHHYVTEHYQQLYLRLKQQTEWALNPPSGMQFPPEPPSAEERAELRRVKEIVKTVERRLKSALRSVRRYKPKGPTKQQIVENETRVLAEQALEEIQELAPRNVRYLPDPAKTFPGITRFTETRYPDGTLVENSRSVLTPNPEDYDDPRYVRLDGNGHRPNGRKNPLDAGY